MNPVTPGSNDYPGLDRHPEVKAAAKRTIDRYGSAGRGSPAPAGTTSRHAPSGTNSPNSRKPKLPRFSARTISQPASPFPFFDPEAGRRGGVYKIPSRLRPIWEMDKQVPILEIFAIFP